MTTQPLLASLAICTAGAALEGVLAGSGFRQRLKELRQPPFSPSFAVWICIGVLYYAACFVVLYQLFKNGVNSGEAIGALTLILLIMAINALWNFFFFRRRNPRAAFLLGFPYVLVAVALVTLLFRINPTAAWTFLPYVIYLGYASWWSYQVGRFNAHPAIR